MFKSIFILIDLCLLFVMAFLGVTTFYRATTLNLLAVTPFNNPFEKKPDHLAELAVSVNQYQAIIDRNLFNTISRHHQKGELINIDGLNQTGLDLKLWGTITSDSGNSYAVIEQKDPKTQELYQEGDAINGAVIKMILKEKVVLRVGRNDEILEMEKNPPSQRSYRQASFFHSVDQNQLASDTSPKQEIVISRNQVNETIQNVHELMTQAQIRPLFEDSKGAAGLAISDIKPDSIFNKMGFRDQDIITGINGKIIKSLDNAVDLYQHLKNSEKLNIQVERRGQTVELNYAIE